MKNTPEVTTALAKIVDDLVKEDFKELPYGLKCYVFHYIETDFSQVLGLKEEQYKEFIERFNETIRLAWFLSEV